MSKIIISPSILSADPANLERDVRLVEEAGAEYLHIDIMDGHFVPNLSYSANVIRALRKKSNLIFDVHLMLQDADKFIDEFAEAGSDIITVHQEAVPNLKETLKNIHSFGKKAGVSLKPGTPVDMILNVLDLTDVVLLMTVEPGFGGQSYLHQVEVDGGITEENVNRPVRAGANIIVSGSAIFNSNNIKDTINKMRKKAEQGVQEREINNF